MGRAVGYLGHTRPAGTLCQRLLLCVQGLNIRRALGKLPVRALAFWLDTGPSRQVIDRKVMDDLVSEFVQLF